MSLSVKVVLDIPEVFQELKDSLSGNVILSGNQIHNIMKFLSKYDEEKCTLQIKPYLAIFVHCYVDMVHALYLTEDYALGIAYLTTNTIHRCGPADIVDALQQFLKDG